MRVVLIKIIWIAIQNSFLMANCAFKYNSKLTYTFPQIYMMQPTPSGDFQHKIHNEMMFVFQQMANESALFYFSFCGQPGEKIVMLFQLHFQSHQFATIKADLAHKRRRVKHMSRLQNFTKLYSTPTWMSHCRNCNYSRAFSG